MGTTTMHPGGPAPGQRPPASARPTWTRLALAALVHLGAVALVRSAPVAAVLLGLAAVVAAAPPLLALARARSRRWDPTRWIDSAVVALSFGALAAAELGGRTWPAGTPPVARVAGPWLPAGGLFLLLLGVRSLLASRPRPAQLRLLAAALAAWTAADVALWWTATARPTTATAASVAALALVALAATRPDRSEAPAATIPWRRLGRVRATVLGGAATAPLASLALHAALAPLDPRAVLVLAVTAAVIAGLVLVRTAGLVRYADDLADERHRSRFEVLAHHAHDAVLIVDGTGVVTWASPAVARVLGRTAAESVDRPLTAAVGERAAQDLAHPLRRLADAPHAATEDLRTSILGPDRSPRELEGVATNLLADPAVSGLVVVLRDVTERVEMARRLEHQAFVDQLSGLANRALFTDRVAHALERSRTSGATTAVLFIDLDDFKAVNDSLGHGHGDELLVIVGQRIGEQLRPVDTVARLGGDEFAVLLEDTDHDRPRLVAERIADHLARPATIAGLRVDVRASIGVALAGADATVADVLRDADLAMYEAKRNGKGCVRAFDPSLHERELRRFTVRSELGRAIEQQELAVHYQPIVDLRTAQVVGAEALLRWPHPERGLVSPAEFVPVAEASGLIVPIGRWVLEAACQQLASWTAAIGPLSMDVNVSPLQLRDPGFVADVAAVLAATGANPDQLVLELTESSLVHDEDATREVLAALADLGVRLAIDDFGTGYSSLAYLQRLPIDIVKIDRAFVDQLGRAGRGRSLAHGIIAIADSLGLGTIAEGVETPAQAADLAALSCIRAQGFHYSRPVDAATFTALATGPLGDPVTGGLLDQPEPAGGDRGLGVGEVDDELGAVGGEHVVADQHG